LLKVYNKSIFSYSKGSYKIGKNPPAIQIERKTYDLSNTDLT